MDSTLSRRQIARIQAKLESPGTREDCPNCGNLHGLLDFYEVSQVPVHSVLLLHDRDEAISYPERDLRLSFCQRCGFIQNRVFDPCVHEYSSRYEETQGFSETFNAFSDRLAQRLIERHFLYGKRIIEIGCGKGEFLTHICELGQNTGLGFDPAYVPDRSRARPSHRVTFIKDFYSEEYANHSADFVCCKMTLEHINETGAFIRMIRTALNDSPSTVIFFQVPDAVRVLQENAFWDIYYEHCSYFSAGSLRYLFERHGFDIMDVWNDYDGQYLMIEARPTGQLDAGIHGPHTGQYELQRQIARFARDIDHVKSEWISYLRQMKSAARRVALWGAGSKAVAFLTTLGISDEIVCTVDINPHKHGTYLPGSGHQVVVPEALHTFQPDTIIVMNPIYLDEIRRDLERLQLRPELVPVTSPPTLAASST